MYLMKEVPLQAFDEQSTAMLLVNRNSAGGKNPETVGVRQEKSLAFGNSYGLLEWENIEKATTYFGADNLPNAEETIGKSARSPFK
uniref:Uncharacterized protein n=1 Tax=Caenorhabditis japonica TaxID=281687 RepID=A0A8R1IHU3_CAEJA